MAAKRKDVTPARRAAFEILRRVGGGAFSSVLLATEEPNLKPADRALCHELVLGVLRWQLFLDKIVEHSAKRKVESLDLPVRIALRLGLYQLRFLSRIPAAAAVNESVTLVRSAKLSSAAAFVNAVLRRAIREADYNPATEIHDPLEKISIATSHPLWLIDRWANSFGLAEAESFARANNDIPPTAFRVVHTRASQEAVLSKLTGAGASIDPSHIAENAFRVLGASAILRELSAEGQIYLQDEASQLVPQLLNLQPGQRALDLCAAPGGKTTLLADRADDEAFIVAADRSATRLTTVTTTTSSHQLHNIKPLLLDANHKLPFAPATFDRVLVDAPCSGTGTLRRNPEIRWRLTNDDIQNFALAQTQFLRHAAEVLKPGGHLVYSTCSVEREENEQVVESFLQTTPGFTLLKTLRTWPHREGSDGFFMALFEQA
ncbi:MAG TPA: 16S rRNA (cytosine(967)-C(5))-methyltransferase RsmB [Pyrinomonadaceae bacterium]|nr:16S rRNA (cytosine(967)-C(5))-methyltransferase RsmB [Pyrinomonadaceae bacterium]